MKHHKILQVVVLIVTVLLFVGACSKNAGPEPYEEWTIELDDIEFITHIERVKVWVNENADEGNSWIIVYFSGWDELAAAGQGHSFETYHKKSTITASDGSQYNSRMYGRALNGNPYIAFQLKNELSVLKLNLPDIEPINLEKYTKINKGN